MQETNPKDVRQLVLGKPVHLTLQRNPLKGKYLPSMIKFCFVKVNDASVVNNELESMHNVILYVLAPYRAFRTRNDKQKINSEIEALKKMRNRMFIKYKINWNHQLLINRSKVVQGA